MKRMYILLNHTITKQQILDAKSMLGICEFIEPDANLKNNWSNIPPEVDNIEPYLMGFKSWLGSASKGDYLLLSGDFGACHRVANWCKERGVTPLYATTKRDATEKLHTNGTIEKTSVFKHIRFREW